MLFKKLVKQLVIGNLRMKVTNDVKKVSV